MDDADWVMDVDDVNDEFRARCSVWWDWDPGVVFGATDVVEDEMVAVWEEVSSGT